MRERERARNISPQLEQTDSHLHGVECKVENLLLYISLFGVPIALPFPVPRRPFSHILPHHRISFPAYTLYNLQVPQTVTSPFCSLSLLPIRLLFSLHLSFLVSALLIFILTCYTFVVFPLPPFGRSFSF